MTGKNGTTSACRAVDALVAYLARVDMQLARAGLDRAERDSVCRQIVEQFHDLLPVKPDQATASQVEEALTKLGSDAAFAGDEVTSFGQALRMIWHRFWIGTPFPLALNDRGRRQVSWSEFIKRLGWVYLIAAASSLLIGAVLVGPSVAHWFVFIMISTIGLPLMIAVRLFRLPVASLPRAEYWPLNRLEHHRLAGSMVVIGSLLFVAALLPAAYVIVAALVQRPIWPIDRPLFLVVVLTLGGLLMLVSLSEAWRRRQRYLRFRRWRKAPPSKR